MHDINQSEALAQSILGRDLDAAECGVLADRMGLVAVPAGGP